MPTARLNGIEINYEALGEGPAMVLAHGYTASLRMWDAQIPALSERYRVIVYDARGHGATSAPADMERYNLARDYVGDQLALMDHLGVDRAHVGGLSMGGMIAQEFALRHPQRLRSLLLFDTGPGMPAAMRDPAVRARMDQVRATVRKAAGARGMAAIVESMRESPLASMARGTASLPQAARAHMETMANMSIDGYLGGAKAMQDWPGTIDRLHRVAVPTLVLVGEHDQLLAASQAMHHVIAGSRYVLLRDCWHGSCVWRPDAFLQATMAFLDDVEAGRSVVGEMTL